MKLNIENHPCFNDKTRHQYGRVHLPVASRCNVQCNFCDRKFDCVNESRPGVTSRILSPFQALYYLEKIFKERGNISVVGVAGPGDPFANPEETMQTLRLVRKEYPEMLLCVATNGLGILPYIDELAELKTTHVTLTINAVDTAIVSKIYSWFRYHKRVLDPFQGSRILLSNQLEAVEKLKEKGIVVKVNSIIIPGVNDEHIPEVAKKMSGSGVDIMNCIPFYRNPNTPFSHIEEPKPKLIHKVQNEVKEHIPIMTHCARCRADAVGLLNEKMSEEDFNLLSVCGEMKSTYSGQKSSKKPYIAVASMEGVLVNQHLGEARQFLIYGNDKDSIYLFDKRSAPESGGGELRWENLANILNDCHTLLVNGVGETPKNIITRSGLKILVVEGLIKDAVSAIYSGRSFRHLVKREVTRCGESCKGQMAGCG